MKNNFLVYLTYSLDYSDQIKVNNSGIQDIIVDEIKIFSIVRKFFTSKTKWSDMLQLLKYS